MLMAYHKNGYMYEVGTWTVLRLPLILEYFQENPRVTEKPDHSVLGSN